LTQHKALVLVQYSLIINLARILRNTNYIFTNNIERFPLLDDSSLHIIFLKKLKIYSNVVDKLSFMKYEIELTGLTNRFGITI